MPKSYGYHANDLQEYFSLRLARFPVFLVKLKSRTAICSDTSVYAAPIKTGPSRGVYSFSCERYRVALINSVIYIILLKSIGKDRFKTVFVGWYSVINNNIIVHLLLHVLLQNKGYLAVVTLQQALLLNCLIKCPFMFK